MANYYNKDLYKILNLTFQATSEEIKTSYRKLARIYHPDVAKNEEDALKFNEIKEAYDILINEASRKKYDVLHGFYKEKIKKEYEKTVNSRSNKYEEYIKKAQQNAKTSEPFTKSINDALDNLFSTSKNKSSKSGNKTPINGSNINLDLTISCFEAANGTNRKVNILHTQPCPNCNGRKFINGTQCAMCNGSGIISLQKKINVKIPKGVSQGSKVRIKKEGNKGLNGGKDGDLFLIINIEKNSYFEIKDLDIMCNLPITITEAIFGAEVQIPMPDGNINIKIPAMTSSGQKLKLAGLGLSNKNKTKQGDMIVTVLIKLPNKYTKEELDLYKKLKELPSYDVRRDMKNGK